MNKVPYLMSARGIVKSYGPTSVLKGFDLSIAAGEVHAFLGGNGAGKSTLIKIISGQIDRDGGSLEFAQNRASPDGVNTSDENGIAVVNQELALLPHLTVAENIALPRRHRGWSVFNGGDARRIAVDALSLIDPTFAQVSVDRLVADLSLHERQLVEIARALDSGASLLLLDEPTANLTAGETERLFAVLRRLTADKGLAVLFVSHRMREIRQIADVCTIIRNGQTAVDRVALKSITDAEIVEQMGQAALGTAQASSRTQRRPRTESNGNEIGKPNALRVQTDGIDLDIPAGTILGLAGPPVGPETLMNALTGVSSAGRWSIARNGVAVTYQRPASAARDGVGFVSGDRSNKGILANLPIVDNLAASARIVGRKRAVRSDEMTDGRDLLDALSIRASSLWDLPASLSGGTQQKLLIARWLKLKPKVLVLEEPTRGVDIRTKQEIYTLIREMAAQGSTIVWWSTEYVELVELCDTVLAFDPDGHPTSVLKHDQINEAELAHATGMAA
ncbi:sugar ABC transporter ATP-binding protein [Paraburkholderia nemoris]|uniref:Ribose import ATP-binding protein RbsA n=1 Tax=Paraburkholderia nemoris TaxID=2793076 RepID=A0ABM8T4V3_9BURK|nr:sugar ABC transporter ATP-binding protein [Paraburkholderia nemoris]CAE6824503.1 Ribose import ATP-binding protein RbsA [Paraburkholderia nemoris]CAE6855671.1 Ribose import ATP-binding protein RbsA [Paraburkholderia nemoris]